jgi:hypothetical protein
MEAYLQENIHNTVRGFNFMPTGQAINVDGGAVMS